MKTLDLPAALGGALRRGWRLGAIIILLGWSCSAGAADPRSRIVLQGFWWDYWNNHYASDWATYLADLAPRLRDLGIEAIWIPPAVKNKNATGSVGYAPFDHYDLGDKWQGGATATRFGNKDQYLRAVAVLHANGLEVIQDIVWNHVQGAGSATGAGGEDPAAWGNRFKNFRYVCRATPAGSEDAADYLARRGRFPKNWPNFHPNPDHNASSDDITADWFGPDICYWRQAIGRSSNATWNPDQDPDYMRNGMRAWSIWLKKQTGVDGFRLDAAKHFESWATKDFVWNLAYNAGFATTGMDMFTVGEYVGSANEMDAWVDAVNSSDGYTDVVGTFDFSLRGALQNMVAGGGNFDLGSLPGAQQQRRARTVPFVNSHDTFRPILSANGQYTGWDSANELAAHIDPNDPRIQAAYAMCFAVDGSPCIYFEDLFDLHSTSQRWTHLPADPAALPVRDYLANLIWCRENLRFTDGRYLVRWQAADLLVIEREAHALIGVNDHGDTWQSASVQTSFPPGTRLHDYSGANQADTIVSATGTAQISVPPCNGSNVRRGYAIWAPDGIATTRAAGRHETTQEWELADDLGDAHPNSLQQGGALPASSTAERYVGRIFPAAGYPVTIDVYPELAGYPVQVRVHDGAAEVAAETATNAFQVQLQPASSRYHRIFVRQGTSTNAAMRVWVKANYTAPRSLSAAPPTLTSPLTPAVVPRHATAQFAAIASGTPPLTYQWQRDGVPILNATNRTLTLESVQASGQISVEIQNDGGRWVSPPASLWLAEDVIPQLGPYRVGPGVGLQWELQGRPGLRYALEASENLATWTPLTTNTAPAILADPTAPGGPQRFYRVRLAL